MIIKLIPETEAEKARSSEIQIENVKEFFLMGNNANEDGDRNEFHEWTGSYRYLCSSLSYFTEILNDERREASTKRKFNSAQPQIRMIEAETDDIDDEDGEAAED